MMTGAPGKFGVAALLATGLAAASVAAFAHGPAVAGEIGQRAVPIQVSYKFPMPVAEITLDALEASRSQGVAMLQKLAREECAALMSELAETCRLSRLKISTRVRNQGSHQPTVLEITGTAKLEITLKETASPQ